MNCPYCGKEMRQGRLLVSCQFTVRWQEEKAGSKLDRFLGFDRKEIQGVDNSLFGNTKIDAHHCAVCKKFIFDGWVDI